MRLTSRSRLSWRLVPCVVTLLGLALYPATAQIAFDEVATIEGPADLVELHDGHLFTTHHTNLTVFDLSDTATPRRVGAISLPEEI